MKKFCFLNALPRSATFYIQRRQARTLIADGYEVYFVVADNKPSEIIDGIHYVPAGIERGNYLQRVLQMPNKVYKATLSIDADAYQTIDPSLLSICVKLKRKKKKVFFNLLEAHPFTFYGKSRLPYFISRIFVYVMSIKMKTSLKKIDAVFAVSEDIMDYLKQWGVNNSYLMGNYPEIDHSFHLSKEEYMNRENVAIYYGHIPRTSRQENFIDVIDAMPDVKYMLAGKFWDNSYFESLKERSGWNKVEFIDGFDRKELPSILSKCTISNTARNLMQVTKGQAVKGSLGIIKIFESMEAALPLLLADVPVYRELVNKYDCGVLVDVNNKDSIRQGIEYLVINKERAYEMGQNGRKAVIEHYSWDVASKLYLKVING